MNIKETAENIIAAYRAEMQENIMKLSKDEIIELSGNIAAQVNVLDALEDFCEHCEEDDFAVSVIASQGKKVIEQLIVDWAEADSELFNKQFEEMLDQCTQNAAKEQFGKQTLEELGYKGEIKSVLSSYIFDEKRPIAYAKKIVDCCIYAKKHGIELAPYNIVDFAKYASDYYSSPVEEFFKDIYKKYQVFDNSYCVADSVGMDYANKILILKPHALSAEYRNEKQQLWQATGGFGCNPKSRGTTVFAKNIANGEECSWRRNEFMGIADMEKMPEWVTDQMTVAEPAEL